jgi:hypothetical protein
VNPVVSKTTDGPIRLWFLEVASIAACSVPKFDEPFSVRPRRLHELTDRGAHGHGNRRGRTCHALAYVAMVLEVDDQERLQKFIPVRSAMSAR